MSSPSRETQLDIPLLERKCARARRNLAANIRGDYRCRLGKEGSRFGGAKTGHGAHAGGKGFHQWPENADLFRHHSSLGRREGFGVTTIGHCRSNSWGISHRHLRFAKIAALVGSAPRRSALRENPCIFGAEVRRNAPVIGYWLFVIRCLSSDFEACLRMLSEFGVGRSMFGVCFSAVATAMTRSYLPQSTTAATTSRDGS